MVADSKVPLDPSCWTDFSVLSFVERMNKRKRKKTMGEKHYFVGKY